MPRRRPSRLRAEARERRPVHPSDRGPVGGARLSGPARAAVLRYERAAWVPRGRMLAVLALWCTADAVVEQPGGFCGEWECCGHGHPVAETRDRIEELLHRVPPRAARELRRLVRAADARLAPTDRLTAGWWHDEHVWRRW